MTPRMPFIILAFFPTVRMGFREGHMRGKLLQAIWIVRASRLLTHLCYSAPRSTLHTFTQSYRALELHKASAL